MRDLRRKADDLPATATEEEKEKIVQKMQQLNTAVIGCVNVELAACLAPGDKGALTCSAGGLSPFHPLVYPLSPPLTNLLIHLDSSLILPHSSAPSIHPLIHCSVDWGDLSIRPCTRLQHLAGEGLGRQRRVRERHPSLTTPRQF